MTREIDLTQGKKAIVDDEDYEWLSQWKWYYAHTGYAVRNSPRVLGKHYMIFMHREIMHTPQGMDTDHIDGNGLNNLRINLRVCSHSRNLQNKGVSINNVSGFKGVSWCQANKKWRARIKASGKEKYIGYFDVAESAALAYDKAARELHGEFAKLNFPESVR